MMKLILINFFGLFLVMPLAFASDGILDPDNSKLLPSVIGTILVSKGKVFKIRDGEEIKAMKDGKIASGDTLKTNKGSFIQVKMVDDTIISVGPESQFEFSNFVARSKSDRKSIYTILHGQIRANFKVKANPGDITIKSKTSSMGVRGTQLLANVKKDFNGSWVTQYALLEGHIEIENLANGKVAEIKPGSHYVQTNNEESGETSSQIIQMSKDSFEELLAEDLPEESDLLPFLPYFLMEKMSQLLKESKTPKSKRAPASIPDKSNPMVDESKNQIPKWKKTLEKLNGRLKEYNQQP